jgi:anti-sigma regulatory factor (Ser/Thr protein kinase)
MPQQRHWSLEQGLYEVCANIVEHGYSLDPDQTIDVWWIPESDLGVVKESAPNLMSSLELEERIKNSYFVVRDYGSPPDKDHFGPPDLKSHKVLIEGRGLGMRIIHEVFEEVRFRRHETEGNLTILKPKMPAYQHT